MDTRPTIPALFKRVCIVARILFVAVLAGGSLRMATPRAAAQPDQTNATLVAISPVVAVTNGAVGAASTNGAVEGTNEAIILDDKYKLVTGDRVSFRIVEDEVESKPLTVTDSGELEVPYIGRVPAVGKTCKQLADEIKALLDKTYYYDSHIDIAVNLKNKPQRRVYIYGYVRLPGPVEILGDEVLTLSQAIIRAGGTTDYANLDDIQITRKLGDGKAGMTNFDVNFREILKGKKDKDPTLQPDDLINVKEDKIHF